MIYSAGGDVQNGTTGFSDTCAQTSSIGCGILFARRQTDPKPKCDMRIRATDSGESLTIMVTVTASAAVESSSPRGADRT